MHRFDVIFVIETVGLPETPSLIINTWHFESSALPATDYDNVRDMLEDFYQQLITDGVISLSYVDEVAVRAYSLNDPEPRSPVYESILGLTGGTGTPMPSEVSIVLTFEAERESGTIRARRRNRKFLAPITAAAAQNDGRISDTVRTLMGAAASDLLAASNAAVNWDWRVWSTTLQQAFPVADGYVDNAFDTQRRRSFGPTQRTIWS